MNSIAIDTVEFHKRLCILFDNQLKFHSHTTNISNKANQLLGLIRRSFDHLDSSMLTKLFTSMVRPTLEYCNSIWRPSFIGLRGYSAELQNFCHTFKTSHMKRDYQYYNYHP